MDNWAGRSHWSPGKISTITSDWRRRALVASGAILLLVGCQSGKLPDQGSYAAKLYVKKCGTCHEAYQPHSMTAAMWAVQVNAMRARMANGGVAPLTPAQRKTILDYLTRNAGHD